MKKILLGAVILSSLAMSGDLKKCTEAFIMSYKLRELSEQNKEYEKKLKGADTNNDFRNERMFLQGLRLAWREVQAEECKGIDPQYYKKVF